LMFTDFRFRRLIVTLIFQTGGPHNMDRKRKTRNEIPCHLYWYHILCWWHRVYEKRHSSRCLYHIQFQLAELFQGND
jgi:hypothetical protein